ncbi:hypothetical protein EMIT047CA2_240041 [Pseudomonas soli]
MDDGNRTHDNRNHNPALYQLSYAHHNAVLRYSLTETWCGRRDSNSYSLRRWNLNPVCLPISPRPHETLRTRAPDHSIEAPLKNLGWTMGIEPTTTGITIRRSTN